MPPPPPDDDGRWEKQLRQVAPQDRTVPVEHRLAEGDAVEVILRIAEDIRCDLIVLGTHGRAGHGRLLMGNVANWSCPLPCGVRQGRPAPGSGRRETQAGGGGHARGLREVCAFRKAHLGGETMSEGTFGPSDRKAPGDIADQEARVRSRLGGRVRDFHLVAVANGVILRGQARTYYVKQLAQHAVMEAATLTIVANQIEVLSPHKGNRTCAGDAREGRDGGNLPAG